ncbi:MAG: hypothetical protein FJ009_21915 [Chloroflexi bacterium]|nr:hypothetical protein [Chloroflexota bacterium]
MSYNAEISRANPSCILFVIDQSGSMQDVMNPTNVQQMDAPMTVDGRTYTQTASGPTKAQEVSDVVTSRIDWWCKSEINGGRIGQKAGSGKAPRARERDVSAIYS